jgi:hypothetical protein|tara:strand:- start:665 stop:1189 length:525 start_codon:yes stop_codon:yes gene_type:complete
MRGNTMAKPVQLGTHDILIDAPRELVFQMMTAFDAGPMPGDTNESSKVISRDDDSQIVEFKSRVGFITYTSVEKVTLDAPERITFNHLSGPLNYACDEFILDDRDGQTLLTHHGEIIWSRIPFFGWFGTVLYTRPMFNRVAARHMELIKTAAEARAARSHVFRRKPKAPPSGQA